MRLFTIRLLTIPLLLLSAATAAEASSPDAWAAFDRRVAEACVKASGLKQARASRIVGFDDTLGKVATLVTGIAPQKALKGARGQRLCIFDKATARTWIDEAEGWSAPKPR